VAAQLAHALDTLVMHEAAIRLRDSPDPNLFSWRYEHPHMP
jgi:hypothetical protein